MTEYIVLDLQRQRINLVRSHFDCQNVVTPASEHDLLMYDTKQFPSCKNTPLSDSNTSTELSKESRGRGAHIKGPLFSGVQPVPRRLLSHQCCELVDHTQVA